MYCPKQIIKNDIAVQEFYRVIKCKIIIGLVSLYVLTMGRIIIFFMTVTLPNKVKITLSFFRFENEIYDVL